jgi:hypothetical protein
MSSGIDDARDLIARQISEIDEEKKRLERVVEALAGPTGRKPRSAAAGPAIRRKVPRKRAKKGQRQEEVLDAILRQPGIKVSEIAKKIAAPPSQVHPIAAGLVKAETARKDGSRFFIAPATTAAEATKDRGAKAGRAKGQKAASRETKKRATVKAVPRTGG